MAHDLPKERIAGKRIALRPADESDAQFVLRLRLDPKLGAHLSPTPPALDRQTQWLRRCAADPEQVYFVIEDGPASPVGTVRLYDLQPDSFCWGSWILQPGAPRTAAIESALLIYDLGFYRLGFARCHFDVRKGNARVVDFHRRFGARIVGETEDDYLFHFFRADYDATRSRYRDFLVPGLAP